MKSNLGHSYAIICREPEREPLGNQKQKQESSNKLPQRLKPNDQNIWGQFIALNIRGEQMSLQYFKFYSFLNQVLIP